MRKKRLKKRRSMKMRRKKNMKRNWTKNKVKKSKKKEKQSNSKVKMVALNQMKGNNQKEILLKKTLIHQLIKIHLKQILRI